MKNASTDGLPRTLSQAEREIIDQVVDWAGSLEQAWTWYHTHRIPSLGDLTAEDLIAQGRMEAVKAYLARLELGGFA